MHQHPSLYRTTSPNCINCIWHPLGREWEWKRNRMAKWVYCKSELRNTYLRVQVPTMQELNTKEITWEAKVKTRTTMRKDKHKREVGNFYLLLQFLGKFHLDSPTFCILWKNIAILVLDYMCVWLYLINSWNYIIHLNVPFI